MTETIPVDQSGRVPDHLVGKVCTGVGVATFIRGDGRFPDLGDLDDGVPRFLMHLRGSLRTRPDGPGVRNEPDRWDIPGGGIDFGESRLSAIRREVVEELGVQLCGLKSLDAVDHFICDEAGTTTEHWVSHIYLARIRKNETQLVVPEEERSKLVALRFMTVAQMHQLPLTVSMAPSLALLTQRYPGLAKPSTL